MDHRTGSQPQARLVPGLRTLKLLGRDDSGDGHLELLEARIGLLLEGLDSDESY